MYGGIGVSAPSLHRESTDSLICDINYVYNRVMFCAGVVVQAQVQRVFGGIESVNGSDVNMGCTSPLEGDDGVRVCKNVSYLVDGCSPDINTSVSDWASQLVTVKKRDTTSNIPHTHVLLTFGFDTAVSLTGIELDLFLCPEWNIGAPYITVNADKELDYYGGLPHENYVPTQSSCNSLSTVRIPFNGALAGLSYSTWHILVSQLQRSIDWVHVGEIRFLGADVTPMTCAVSVESFSAMEPTHSELALNMG